MPRIHTLEEQLIYSELLRIQNLKDIPIADVVETISGNQNSSNDNRGGFVKYSQLIEEAKKDYPFEPKKSSAESKNPVGFDANDAFKALTNAAAEAIVFKEMRDMRTAFGTPSAVVFHDPVAQGTVVASRLPAPFDKIGLEAYKSFGDKTPDLLLISPPQKVTTQAGSLTNYWQWSNIVDLNNYKNTNLLPDKDASGDKILVSPVEVTTTGSAKDIKDKIKKFENYGSAFFKNSTTVRYAPILLLDYDRYMENKDSQKKAITKAMKKAGGIIVLEPGLYEQ
jgi:hypothetical protein